MKTLGLGFVLSMVVGVWGPGARAEQRNKCGCYKDEGAGTCYCEKKAKCGCPGECDPKGCEEARERELQKQINAETKKAEESGHHKRSGDENGDNGPASDKRDARGATRADTHKMSPAQAKQLSKLIDLYLTDHPDARSRPIAEVRDDLSR